MAYIAKKFIQLILTLVLVSIITFAAFWIVPGDPARIILGPNATPEQVSLLSEELGLDRPLGVRYLEWLGGALTLDMGESLSFKTPVTDLIAQKLPVTLALSVISLLMTMIVSFPLAMIAARRPGKFTDHVVSVVTHSFFAVPPFVLSLFLTLIFGIGLNLFQVGRFVSHNQDFWGFIGYLIMPSIAIALPKIAMALKFIRSSILSEKEKDYVRTAKSHGLSDSDVMRKHILPNALVPVITVFAIISADILGGSLIVEQVFGLPGIGRLLLQGISSRDFPLTEGIIIYLAGMIAVVYFIADIMHSLIDPRIRLK